MSLERLTIEKSVYGKEWTAITFEKTDPNNLGIGAISTIHVLTELLPHFSDIIDTFSQDNVREVTRYFPQQTEFTIKNR